MKLKEEIYYCNQCKKVFHNLEKLLFVEEGSVHAFCSEQCIEKFYAPIVDYYSEIVSSFQDSQNENYVKEKELLEDSLIINNCLQYPDEIWRHENQLKEDIYFFHSKYEKEETTYTIISICFVFNKTASFVLSLCVTQDSTLIKEFQVGSKIEAIEEYRGENLGEEENLELDFIESTEHYKSQFLAEMMENRLDSDIDIEQFNNYMEYLTPSLETPDEVYSHHQDTDFFNIYIKSFEKDNNSFFYIIICLLIKTKEDEDIGIPFLSFPTIDGDLCSYFRKGEQISGGLKN